MDPEEVKWPSLANIVAGFWLILMPFVVLDYTSGLHSINRAVWNEVYVGIAIAVLGGIRAIWGRHAWSALAPAATLLLGIWLVVAPWALGFLGDAVAMGNHILVGVLVVAFSASDFMVLWMERGGRTPQFASALPSEDELPADLEPPGPGGLEDRYPH